jgi:hypothetical protein
MQAKIKPMNLLSKEWFNILGECQDWKSGRDLSGDLSGQKLYMSHYCSLSHQFAFNLS